MPLHRVVFSTLFFCSLVGANAAVLTRFSFERAGMGVPIRVTLYAEDQPTAQGAANAVFERIDVLNSILSDYDPDSEVSRLSASSGSGISVPVSTELWRVLSASMAFAEASEGAFDFTIGPLVNVWRNARRKKELPSKARLLEYQARVGYRHVQLDKAHQAVQLGIPDMRLDFGGIAKGYAVDAAVALLRARGFPICLVAASGDMMAGDPPPGQEGWRVEVAGHDASGAPASELVLLNNSAVSTSGDVFQHLEINGVRYSHIVNPRTGLGLTDRSLVNVTASDAATADALATTASVLGSERALEFIERYPGAAARITWESEGTIKVRTNSRWAGKALPRPE